MLALDHFAISAASLAAGAAHVEAALGLRLDAGGVHPAMGTHNRLLGLGPGEYLEVIAVDPAAPPPGRPRWFDLDNFSGPPRITNWILRCDDLDAALRHAPPPAGRPVALARGDFRWRMAVPDDGRLPFGGAYPALIEWQGGLKPQDRLAESGCRLLRFEVFHPEAEALARALPISDPRVFIREGVAGFRAALSTPSGERVLE